MDRRKRDLERRAAQGDLEAQVGLLAAQVASGQVTQQELEAMAARCDSVALKVLGEECGDRAVVRAAGRKNKLSGREAERVIEAYYRANGWTVDSRSSSGALLSPDGLSKLAFRQRVWQRFSGGRGRWVKQDYGSKIELAEDLLVRARSRAKGKQAGAALEQAVSKRREKQAARSSAQGKSRERLALAVRLAVVQLAGELTPEGRAAVMLDRSAGEDYRREVERRAERLVGEVSGLTEAKIDSSLSLDEPPIPVEGGFLKSSYKGAHEWRDRRLGRRVLIRRRQATELLVEIGHMPVDPLAGVVSLGDGPADDPLGDGLVGSLRVVQGRRSRLFGAFLFMVSASEARRGSGTNFLRAWCRLITAMGTERVFAAEGVSEQGLAWLEALDRRGEIEITRREGKSLFARCLLALSDPRQQALFFERRR